MDKSIFIAGPEPKLELAYSDVWLPGLYSRRVFVFELPATSSHTKALAVLERALKALVDGTPELGGESVIVPAEQHDGKMPWRAIKAYKGIELVVKDLTASFPSFAELDHRGFPLAVFKDRLLMPIPFTIMPEPQPQAKFQATLIEGGILLSTCIYHHLSDGNGMNAITRALGAACKRAAESPDELAPVVLDTDRTIMRNLRGTQTDLSLYPAHEIAPNIYLPGAAHDDPHAPTGPSADEGPNAPPAAAAAAPSDAPPAPPVPTAYVPGFFRITDASATRLRDDMRAGSGHATVSTHDAIGALLWRTLMLARHATGKLADDALTTYTFPHNARRHVGLPADWVGNCVYFCLVQATVAELSRPDIVPALAAQVRAQLEAVNRERVAGIMSIRRPDPYSLAWWPINDPSDNKIHAITSFYQSGLLGIDWGAAWGPVRHFTSTDAGAIAGGFERTSFVGPKIGGGRGCDVMVGADKGELDFFRKDALWNQYFEPLPSEPLDL